MSESIESASPIGVVVICHGRLGEELIRATEFIVGTQEAMAAIATGQEYDIEKLHQEIEAALRSVDQGRGVLILTDMFGGTPSNLGLAFMEEGRIEILTGVNLPMMIKLVRSRQDPEYEVHSLAEFLKGYAQRNIVLASDILKAENPSRKNVVKS